MISDIIEIAISPGVWALIGSPIGPLIFDISSLVILSARNLSILFLWVFLLPSAPM